MENYTSRNEANVGIDLDGSNYNNSYNGKVNIMGPNLSTKFSMMDKIPINVNTNYQNVLTGNFERSRLSDAYFSKQNIQIIQNGIRKGVYDKSQQKILIDNQPEDQIVTVMRSMYLQHSKNLEINFFLRHHLRYRA